jgi:hypothetical protein
MCLHRVACRGSGFLLKDVTPEQLVGAVRLVAMGDALLAPTITRRLVEPFAKPPEPSPAAAAPITVARGSDAVTIANSQCREVAWRVSSAPSDFAAFVLDDTRSPLWLGHPAMSGSHRVAVAPTSSQFSVAPIVRHAHRYGACRRISREVACLEGKRVDAPRAGAISLGAKHASGRQRADDEALLLTRDGPLVAGYRLEHVSSTSRALVTQTQGNIDRCETTVW